MPTPPQGQKKVKNENFEQTIGISPTYQCAGRPYQEYMLHNQLPFVLNKTLEENSEWGRRPSILPAANKNILIIGNSHTRQMGISLLCMYKEQVLSFEELPFKKEGALKYASTNNNSISFITNPSYIYSSKWNRNLEEFVLHKPLEEFDAIVLGLFNAYNPRYKETKFWSHIEVVANSNKDLQIDLDSKGDPNLWLEEWLNVYSGPIIFTGMFAEYRAKKTENAKVLFQHHSKNGRNNLRTIDGRKYFPMLNDVECSTTPSSEITTCIQEKDDDAYSNGHRCMGCLGGSPDMTSWDVVESLWDVLSF